MIWKRLHWTRASRPTPFLGIFLVFDYLHFVAVVIVILSSVLLPIFSRTKRPVSSLMRETFGGHFAFYSTEFGIFCQYQQGNSTKEPIVVCTLHIPVEARIQFLLVRISYDKIRDVHQGFM